MTRPTVLDMDLVVTPRKSVPLPYDLQNLCDDPFCEHGCAEMRKERDEFNRKHNGPDPAWDDVRKYVERLEKDNNHLQRLFDQQWKRTREAGELWRQAHPGNDNVSPDLGELVKWLVDRAEAAEACIAELEKMLSEADSLIQAQQHDFAQNNIRNAENAHKVSELEKRLADAERVIRGLLYCPAIADGEQNDPSWGCEETAEAERAARAYLEGK